ncbi:hypothetical protein PRIC1_013051 [Phytophthora ramorum]
MPAGSELLLPAACWASSDPNSAVCAIDSKLSLLFRRLRHVDEERNHLKFGGYARSHSFAVIALHLDWCRRYRAKAPHVRPFAAPAPAKIPTSMHQTPWVTPPRSARGLQCSRAAAAAYEHCCSRVSSGWLCCDCGECPAKGSRRWSNRLPQREIGVRHTSDYESDFVSTVGHRSPRAAVEPTSLESRVAGKDLLRGQPRQRLPRGRTCHGDAMMAKTKKSGGGPGDGQRTHQITFRRTIAKVAREMLR